MRTALNLFLITFSALMLWHCEPKNAVDSTGDKILAEVGNKKLFISELEGMIPANTTREDSSLIINALVERWAREAVLLNEAEMNVPKNLNINKLVRDYRSSLIKGNYERILIEEHLDSVVTNEELTKFYELSKAQFTPDQPILRCRFLKISKEDSEIDELKNWWKNYSEDSNSTKLKEYAETHATIFKLNDEAWYDLSEIAQELPPGKLTASNIHSKKSIETTDDYYHYFYYPIETVKKDMEPPFDYVKGKIKRVILHRRKKALLDSKKEEMYSRELRRNSVKIYK